MYGLQKTHPSFFTAVFFAAELYFITFCMVLRTESIASIALFAVFLAFFLMDEPELIAAVPSIAAPPTAIAAPAYFITVLLFEVI